MTGPPGALIIPLIASLSLDTFAVSTAIGVAPLARTVRLRFAVACTLAETGMPIIGFVAGGLVGRIGTIAGWLAVVLLLGVGLWTLREALEDDDEVAEALERAEQGGMAVVLAALSVSLDELAVGAALGTLHVPIVPVVIAIAVQALVASLLGLRLGAVLGSRIGNPATMLAGAALCAVAVGLAVVQLSGHG